MPPGFEAFYNGSLEISETYNRVTIANTRDLTPPILAITLIALYWMFRSIRKTLRDLRRRSASACSGRWASTRLLGFDFNVLTSMLTPLVVVLAIADDVHIVQHFDHELRATGSKKQAFKSSITHLFAPLLGASGTTALGMLSLATSDVVAVRTFGIGAGDRRHGGLRHLAGVRADAADVASRPDAAPPPQERWLMVPLQTAGRFAYAHARLVLAVVIVLSAVAAGRRHAAARRHQPHQLLRRGPSAVAVGRHHRPGAVRHLQLQHPARRAAGLAEDAGCARAHRAAVARARAACRTSAR